MSKNIDISLSESYINGSERLSPTLMNATGNNIYITNSTFWNLTAKTGPAVIIATQSKIHINNVYFVKCMAVRGLIRISDRSNLVMKNVTFKENGVSFYVAAFGAITVLHGSSAECVKCTFYKNNASFCSCVYSDSHSVIKIQDSEFFYNEAVINGGAICCEPSDLSVNQLRKVSQHPKPGIFVTNSSFHGNYVKFSGGVIHAQPNTSKQEKYSVKIESSRFSANIASQGGDIHVLQSVSLSIKNSTFYNFSQPKIGISVFASSYCNVMISQSNFMVGGLLDSVFPIYLFLITENSNFIAVDTIFQGRKPISFVNDIVMMSVAKNSQVRVFNCTFNQTSGIVHAEEGAIISIENSIILGCFGSTYQDFLFFIYNNCYLFLSDTEIKNNTNDNSFLSATTTSTVSMFRCIYENNHVASHMMVANSVNVTIIECHFLNNKDTGTEGIIYVSGASAVIRDSEFRNNVAPQITIFKVSKGTVEFKNCTMEWNTALDEKTSLMSALHSKVIIHNCQFSHNTVFGSIVKVSFIS